MENTSPPWSNSKKPFLLSFRSSPTFITAVISYAVFTEQFIYAVIVPVAPFAVQERLHMPEDRVQYWIAVSLAVYGIASLIASPPCGWWADRTQSRRLPFLFGLLSMLGATILLWLAANNTTMVLGRILQGVASTVTWTTGEAMLVDTVGEARIGEHMGYVGLALNLGTLVAPALGGVVFERVGYNAVFAMAFAVVGFDVVLRLMMVERSVAEDWMPNATIYGDVEMVGHSESQEELKKPKMTVSVAASEVSSLSSPSASCETLPLPDSSLPRKERTLKDRLPPILTLLFSWRFLSALWGCFVQASIYSGFQTVLPLALNHMFGWNSIGGGLIFVPLVAPSLLGPVVGMLSDRFGPRWLTTAGFLGLCPSLVLLRLVDRDDLAHKVLLCVILALVGCCFTLILEPLLTEITYLGGNHGEDVDQKGKTRVGSYAQAYALFNLAWSLGDTVGPLWAGLVIETAGWNTMTSSLGLLAGVSAIPTVLWCGGCVFSKSPANKSRIR